MITQPTANPIFSDSQQEQLALFDMRLSNLQKEIDIAVDVLTQSRLEEEKISAANGFNSEKLKVLEEKVFDLESRKSSLEDLVSSEALALEKAAEKAREFSIAFAEKSSELKGREDVVAERESEASRRESLNQSLMTEIAGQKEEVEKNAAIIKNAIGLVSWK